MRMSKQYNVVLVSIYKEVNTKIDEAWWLDCKS